MEHAGMSIQGIVRGIDSHQICFDQDPVNQDFQNLASAVSNNQADTTRSVWAQLTSDMAKDGVTNFRSPAEIAADAVAQSKASDRPDHLVGPVRLVGKLSRAPDKTSFISGR